MNKTLLSLTCSALLLPSLAFADGKTDYNAHCAGCHGANGNVQTEKAKALNMDVKKLALKVSTKNKAEMTAFIEKGKGKMPSFDKQLTKEQISAIADYIITLR
jgi:mono/diheme cytochrome c family protein